MANRAFRLSVTINAIYVLLALIVASFLTLIVNLDADKKVLVDAHQRAQLIAKHASRLAAVTNGIAAESSPTHQAQWLAIYADLMLGIDGAQQHGVDKSDLLFMRETAADLADLYSSVYSTDDGESLTPSVLQRRIDILSDRMISEAQQLVEFSGGRARHYLIKNEEAFALSRFVTLIFVGVILFLVVSLLVIIQVSVLKPLDLIGEMINQVQSGNLTARVDVQSPYELGRVAEQLNSFAASLAAKLQKLVEINSELELEVKEKEISKRELSSALRELQLIQNVLEGAGRMCGVGGWHIDLKTNQLTWSNQTYAIVEAPLSYSPTVESAINLYEGEAKQVIAEGLQRCQETGEKLDVELPFITFTGRRIWVQVYGELIFEHNGKEKIAVAIVGAFQDITLRRKQESELKASIRLAESASLAKGDFLANMSHEIRTPLNAVVGLSYMLRKTVLSGDQLSILDKLEMSARTLIGLVSDILDFSKIEAGSMELDSEVTESTKFFDTLSSIGAGLPLSSDVDLIFELDKKIPDCWVIDGLKLKQILLNLLSNAAKFTSEGQVSLACKVIDLNTTHAHLRFEVSDTGIGMSEEVQSRLFQPFSQGDSSISRRFGGTGVGLALSQKLVGMMGGEIKVLSKPDEGSTFYFDLNVPWQASSRNAEQVVEAQKKQFVLFCDRPVWTRVFLESFEKIGLSVLCKNEYEQLADFVEENRTDDVILLLSEPRDKLNAEAVMRLKRILVLEDRARVIFVEHGRHSSDIAYLIDQIFNIVTRICMPVTPGALLNCCLEMTKPEALSETMARKPLEDLRVLAVDDNKMNLMVLRGILEHNGASVRDAANGEQAVRILRDHNTEFDLCLMDVQMPLMNGLEATKLIRDELNLRHFPIVALTAGAMLAEHQNALNAGMDDVLTKPIDANLLVKTVLKQIRSANIEN